MIVSAYVQQVRFEINIVHHKNYIELVLVAIPGGFCRTPKRVPGQRFIIIIVIRKQLDCIGSNDRLAVDEDIP